MLTENGKSVKNEKLEKQTNTLTAEEKTMEQSVIDFPSNSNIDGDIDLSEIRKKCFRINNDNSKILELNISDMNTIVRLNEDYPKLMDLARSAVIEQNDSEKSTEEELAAMSDLIKKIDNEMRELIDHIFDSNVSELCASDGSMYDLFNGKFRFEYIIEKIASLYGENISKELKSVTKRIQKHTGKYTGK